MSGATRGSGTVPGRAGSALARWARGLRFPWLVAILGAVLVIDLIVPDVVPFVDEVVLALVTAGLASRRKRSRVAGGRVE